jgi:hypothetical protein
MSSSSSTAATAAARAFAQVPSPVWVAIAVVALVAVVSGLARAAGSRATLASPLYVRQLLEAAAEYARKSEQDGTAAHRLRDAHYGLAYVNAARATRLSDAELERLSGVRIADLVATLRAAASQREPPALAVPAALKY